MMRNNKGETNTIKEMMKLKYLEDRSEMVQKKRDRGRGHTFSLMEVSIKGTHATTLATIIELY